MKKLIAVLSAAVVLAASVFFVFIFKGSDGVTAAELVRLKGIYKTMPYEVNAETGVVDYPEIIALCGCNNSDKNTFLGTKTAINSRAHFVEVRVAANSNGTVVLADSFADISAEATEFRRVTELAADDDSFSLLVNLAEYNNLNSVSSLLSTNRLRQRSMICGITENSLDYVKSFFPGYKLFCDYDSDTKMSFEELKAAGAAGVVISASTADKKLIKKAHEASLIVWVNDIPDTFSLLQSAASGADGLMTLEPDKAYSLTTHWKYEFFKSFNENK